MNQSGKERAQARWATSSTAAANRGKVACRSGDNLGSGDGASAAICQLIHLHLATVAIGGSQDCGLHLN